MKEEPILSYGPKRFVWGPGGEFERIAVYVAPGNWAGNPAGYIFRPHHLNGLSWQADSMLGKFFRLPSGASLIRNYQDLGNLDEAMRKIHDAFNTLYGIGGRKPPEVRAVIKWKPRQHDNFQTVGEVVLDAGGTVPLERMARSLTFEDDSQRLDFSPGDILTLEKVEWGA